MPFFHTLASSDVCNSKKDLPDQDIEDTIDEIKKNESGRNPSKFKFHNTTEQKNLTEYDETIRLISY